MLGPPPNHHLNLRSQLTARIDWLHGAMLCGVFLCAAMPLYLWGSTGTFLAGWIGLVGISLILERYFISSLIITFGLIGSLGADLPASRIHAAPEESDAWLLNLGIGICLSILVASIVVWWFESTPIGWTRILRAFLVDVSNVDLQPGQFSLMHLLGVLTVVSLCAGSYELGDEEALLLTPLILITAGLVALQKYRLAILATLAIAFAVRMILLSP